MKRLLDEKIELSDAAADYVTSNAGSLYLLPSAKDNKPSLDSIKTELPLVEEISSPNTINIVDAISKHSEGVADASDGLNHGSIKIESLFDDALLETLDAHRSVVNAKVEQEQYDPIGSVSRVQVPIMDFGLPPLAWEDIGPDPKLHFSRILQEAPASLSPVVDDTAWGLDRKLDWVPVARDSARVSVEEKLADLSIPSQLLLDPGAGKISTSSSYIAKSEKLAVLNLGSDKELEQENGRESQHVPSPYFRTMSPPPKAIITLTKPKAISETRSSKPVGSSLMDLVKTKSEGIMTESFIPAPEDGQIINTETLLMSFMEMRAAKRPRLVCQPADAPAGDFRKSSHTVANQTSPSIPSSETMQESVQESAPCPVIQIPDEKAKYIVSIDLPRHILSQLETAWPPENLIDRQFSVISYSGVSSVGNCQMKSNSEVFFEADIVLTAGDGIIITSLPKATQRPLPGSGKLPQLRERVATVSMKYERLIVLVSEMNPSGEFVGEPSASDLAAYSDFVRFTVALETDVSAFLISGGHETTTRWVLAFMCRYSPIALRTNMYLSTSETT
jgi:hypothetical protein